VARPTFDAPFVFNGHRRLGVDLPCDFEPPVALPQIDDVAGQLQRLLAAPAGSPPLTELAAGATTVVVVVPDASRTFPTAVLLPAIVEHLNRAGVADAAITVVTACGLHRTTTAAEKTALAGPALAGRLRIEDAQGQSPDTVDLGQTAEGRPVVMDRRVAQAELVVSLGVVEPHLYAGFSGGVKTVAIGCAGEATIAWTHDPVFLDDPRTCVGQLTGSPFRTALTEIAARTGLRFAVNVVVDGEGRVAGLAAGDPPTVQRALVETHASAWWRSRDDRYDLIVAGVPAPKHEGLYHASRAATYLTLVDDSVLADGGLVVVCTDLPRGMGDGPGELNFGHLLATAKRPDEIIERARREPLGPGGQRAYMVARLLQRYRLGVMGSADPALVERLGIESFATVAAAFAAARRDDGAPPRVLVVADAFDTLVERRRRPRGPTPSR
jgi:lactate racemase